MKVIGINFTKVGKNYWFDPLDVDYNIGDKVVVETIRGLEIGTVSVVNVEIEEKKDQEVKPVLRKADDEDLKILEENIEEAKNSIDDIKKIVLKSGLEMKVVNCQYTLDREKLIVFYTADGRVDFRELVKDLAREFQIRIELRQISSREEAKLVGGLGICGMKTCCSRHLREIDFVTMKDAKAQEINLSSGKSMGLCGKLMCCINYETSLYEEIKKSAPKIGEFIKTEECNCAEVVSINYISGVISAKPVDSEMTFKTEISKAKTLSPKEVEKEKAKGVLYKEKYKTDFKDFESGEDIDASLFDKTEELKKIRNDKKKTFNRDNKKRSGFKKRDNRRGDVEVTTIVIPGKK